MEPNSSRRRGKEATPKRSLPSEKKKEAHMSKAYQQIYTMKK